MKTHLIRVGNSRGIRIPKLLLEQTGLQDEVEIQAENGSLVIRPVHKPRHDWEAAFREMAQREDDSLLDSDMPPLSRWDEDEWQW